jgi:hypothetical protein
MTAIKIGSVVTLQRFGETRYVVAEFVGGPNTDFVKLVRKKPEGGYASFVRPADGLVEEAVAPFTFGEKVKINAIPEEGTYVLQQDGIAVIDVPGWSKPLRDQPHDPRATKLAIPPSTAHVSYWSLVLENRL